MRQLEKGFSLIELMIIVAIIGILAMFALPAYQDYTKRTHLMEGVNLAKGLQIAIAKHYIDEGFLWEGDFEVINSAYGYSDDIRGNAVKKVIIDGIHPTRIEIIYNDKVKDHRGARLYLKMSATSNGSIMWICYPKTDTTSQDYIIKEKWLPPSCYATDNEAEIALNASGQDGSAMMSWMPPTRKYIP